MDSTSGKIGGTNDLIPWLHLRCECVQLIMSSMQCLHWMSLWSNKRAMSDERFKMLTRLGQQINWRASHGSGGSEQIFDSHERTDTNVLGLTRPCDDCEWTGRRSSKNRHSQRNSWSYRAPLRVFGWQLRNETEARDHELFSFEMFPHHELVNEN